jgi:hypothetical protein
MQKDAILITACAILLLLLGVQQYRISSIQRQLEELTALEKENESDESEYSDHNNEGEPKPVLEKKVVNIPRKETIVAPDSALLEEMKARIDSLHTALEKARKISGSQLDLASVSAYQQKDFLQFPTGKKGELVNYLGEIQHGKANGRGVAVWKNGGTYQGEWKDNLREGRGAYTWYDGEKYIGEYARDLREGQGTYITKNGEKYEGGWRDDKREGEGKLYDKAGKLKLEGIWKADKLTKVVREY